MEQSTGDLVYLVLLLIIMVVGNVGNILVIAAVLSDRNLRGKEGNLFIVNLAVADLCVTGFVDPFSAAGIFVGPEFWAEHNILCHVVGAVCLVSCVCSLWTIAAISFNRYVLLCQNHIYHRIFSRTRTYLFIAMLWLGALCLDLPNFLDWGDHVYDLKTMACSYDRTASYSYTVFFIFMFVTFPLIIVFFYNMKIYLFVRQSKIRVSAHKEAVWSTADESTAYDPGSQWTSGAARDESSGPSRSTPTGETAPTHSSFGEKTPQPSNRAKPKGSSSFRQEVKLAKTLFIIFIVFCVSWTPYALMCLIVRHDQWPKEAYTYGILLAHSSSTVNSILYAATNKGFRAGYKNLIKKCFRCF